MRIHLLIKFCILISLLHLSVEKAFSQCLEIQSILVDACGGNQEGLNEMVRFQTGSSINANSLSVTWPNNSWQGVAQNTATANVTAALNADILAAGGCGQLIQPPGGIIPANATVILITSYVVDIAANPFGPLDQDIYIIFQNNSTTIGGHFANSGSGTRTLIMSSGSCTDFATYNRALLTGGDGATVQFTDAGIASYINNGCSAPTPLFTVDANAAMSACPGETVSIAGTAEGEVAVKWTAASGTFANANSLVTTYTVSPSSTGNVILTLTATNQCGVEITDTKTISINAGMTPNFTTSLAICNGESVTPLNTISPNGISGTWSPSVVNNTIDGNYIFTPNPGQCATTATLAVTITPATVPNFPTTLMICNGQTVAPLNNTSPNGISGTWSPSAVNNTIGGNYIFTPNPGQCATTATLAVTIAPSTVPNFPTTLIICSGQTVAPLNNTSPNGISGTWSPAVIDNTIDGNYIFTPNPGQCATTATLAVTIAPSTVPNFPTTLIICSGQTVAPLNNTSPNGISGAWSPAVIDNTIDGNYIFTPNPGQCATTATLAVTIAPSTVPNFPTTLMICIGQTVAPLNNTSPNGISGTWSPAVIDNTIDGNYIFTPNPGQCATTATLAVTIAPSTVPNFPTTLIICSGQTVAPLNNTSPNGISGAWSPAVIDNTIDGNYIFTPNPGQCATTATLAVTIAPSTVPNFPTTLMICIGQTVAPLNNTSPNGISGTWSPAVIDNTIDGNYIFTPNSGQCATTATLAVTIAPSTVPNFPTTLMICSGQSVTPLSNTSPNGISGTWNPAFVNNTISGNYIFTPNLGQCAVQSVLTVSVHELPNPLLSDAFLCIDSVTGDTINTVTLSTGISDPHYNFVWTLNGNLLPTTTTSHEAIVIGTYMVTATNLLTGCSGTATAVIRSSTEITAVANVGEDFDYSQTINVTVTGGSGDYEFQLENGPVQNSNIFTNISEGEYHIVVRDKQGCSEVKLDVYAFNYPRYFTPNNDGIHDFWNINGFDQNADLISIFDRYGKLLKVLKPSENSGWNGTFNGHDLPSSDYWFTLKYHTKNGEAKEFKAHFTLKR